MCNVLHDHSLWCVSFKYNFVYVHLLYKGIHFIALCSLCNNYGARNVNSTSSSNKNLNKGVSVRHAVNVSIRRYLPTRTRSFYLQHQQHFIVRNIKLFSKFSMFACVCLLFLNFRHSIVAVSNFTSSRKFLRTIVCIWISIESTVVMYCLITYFPKEVTKYFSLTDEKRERNALISASKLFLFQLLLLIESLTSYLLNFGVFIITIHKFARHTRITAIRIHLLATRWHVVCAWCIFEIRIKKLGNINVTTFQDNCEFWSTHYFRCVLLCSATLIAVMNQPQSFELTYFRLHAAICHLHAVLEVALKTLVQYNLYVLSVHLYTYHKLNWMELNSTISYICKVRT